MSGRLPGELSTHTHFFRGEAELEEALTVLSDRAAAGRSPHLWCAGCSTGAEPYTLAMLCAERGITAHIHATDLNPEALAAARAARFPEIALRFAPAHLRERYFERAGQDYAVVPRIVERVTFEQSDLRSDPLPLRPSGHGDFGWDVILCRNVLIYYEPDTAGAIVARLAAALRPDGVLIVGSTDPLAFRPQGALRVVSLGGVASYARAVHASHSAHRPLTPAPASLALPGAFEPLLTPPPAPLLLAPASLALVPAGSVAAGGRTSVAGAPASPVAASGDELEPLLAAACVHLAEHLWDEAEGVLLRAESAAPLAPEPSLYLGMLRRKQGRFAEATEHLRRAVFLTPRCWIASYLLAGVWDRLGDRVRARLELTRTLTTLQALEPEAARRAWPIGAEVAGLAFDPAEVARACRARLGA